MVRPLEVTRDSLRSLLNDEAQKGDHVTDLQKRLTEYEMEARALRAQVRTHEEASKGMENHIACLEQLVTEVATMASVSLADLVRATDKFGLEPHIQLSSPKKKKKKK